MLLSEMVGDRYRIESALVLILVFLDVTFWEPIFIDAPIDIIVLILVFLDVTFWGVAASTIIWKLNVS